MALKFYQFIKSHAQAQPDHPAIIDGDATVTYAQLLDQVERFAGGLDSLSINPDGKLGLLCLNQKEYLIAFLGALLKGLPVVPYNFMLTPEDLIYITRDAGVDHLVVNPVFIKPGTVPFFSKFKVLITTSPAPDLGLPAMPAVENAAISQYKAYPYEVIAVPLFPIRQHTIQQKK